MTPRKKATAISEAELEESLEAGLSESEGSENEEVSTRFLRERENRLDRQTLRLAQALIRAGFKVTDPRLAILEEVVRFNREFEITELAERLEKRSGFKPGIASVFRTVKLLTELGLLQRLHTGDGCHRYGLIHTHNHQVICRCCERAVEFEGCDFTALTSFLEKQTGFKLEGHWMEFYGLCTDCRAAAVEGRGVPVAPLAPHSHSDTDEEIQRIPLNVSNISQVPGR